MVCVKVGEASCRGGDDPQRGEYYTYYETIAGGPGSRHGLPDAHATYLHMTNTLNTPIEAVVTGRRRSK
jgi:N-methylhydantoinase B